MDKFQIRPITDRIILLTFSTQKQLASTLIRFQEHYESPFPEMKGQIFTLGQLKATYSETNQRGMKGANNYISGNNYLGAWNGFNFPSSILSLFVQGLFDPLTEGEQDIVELFRYRRDSFYLIGIHTEKGEDFALNHEIAHGMFYTIPEYREAVLSLLSQYPESEKMRDVLSLIGYNREDDYIVRDETHAYLGVDYDYTKSDKWGVVGKVGIDLESLRPLSLELTKLFNKFHEEATGKGTT